MNISSTYERIRYLTRKTPCVTSHELAKVVSRTCNHLAGATIILKCENLQFSGSFKYRGALNKLLQLSPEQLDRGLVTYSTGM
jgi:threonine dehydratase